MDQLESVYVALQIIDRDIIECSRKCWGWYWLPKKMWKKMGKCSWKRNIWFNVEMLSCQYNITMYPQAMFKVSGESKCRSKKVKNTWGIYLQYAKFLNRPKMNIIEHKVSCKIGDMSKMLDPWECSSMKRGWGERVSPKLQKCTENQWKFKKGVKAKLHQNIVLRLFNCMLWRTSDVHVRGIFRLSIG
jgi:hypothetical protein